MWPIEQLYIEMGVQAVQQYIYPFDFLARILEAAVQSIKFRQKKFKNTKCLLSKHDISVP